MRKLVAIGVAACSGAGLAVASQGFAWSRSTTFLVGCLLAAVLGLFGPWFIWANEEKGGEG